MTSPGTLLLARYDASGRLRLIARTTPLATAARRELGAQLRLAGSEHPWHGRSFSVGWGTRGELEYHPVDPEIVVEFLADTAVDEGRYRHPVQFLRVRAELHPMHVPKFAESGELPGGGGATE